MTVKSPLSGCANQRELCGAIADEIARRIGGAAKPSNQSASFYVVASAAFETDDDYESEDYCVRVSDHEARSYNREGDYRICVAPQMQGDPHQFVRAWWANESGEETSRPGDGATFHFDAEAAAEAVDEAVGAFERFKADFIARTQAELLERGAGAPSA